MKRLWKTWMPMLVLMLGAVGTISLIRAHPVVETRAPGRQIPLVKAMEVERGPVQVRVLAQGSVTPRTESELVAEVSGRIIRVSPGLASGGFVAEGEILVALDPGDYEVAAERAAAALARAESEQDVARSSLERIRNLHGSGVASASRLEDAVNLEHVADAARRDAAAARLQARRDLDRTLVRAPFAGRVREKRVDVGQFVSRGSPVARIYAVDYVEVRLPLTDEDAAFVDLPIDYRDGSDRDAGPAVRLRGRFAGRDHEWSGRIVRTEGEIDPRTRMIHAVARVEDPYGRGDEPGRPPLAVGLFVDAEIEGRILDDALAIPRSALRGRDELVVVDAEDRLRLRRVEVLRRERDRVLIGTGLELGDRVSTTPLSLRVEGMRVRVAPVSPALPGGEIAKVRSAP